MVCPGYKGCSTYFPGPFNSLSFDGSNDYVILSDSDSIPFEFQKTDSFSVSFWYKAGSTTDGVVIGNSRNNGGSNTAIGWAIKIDGSLLRIWFVSYWNDYGINPQVSFTFSNNIWYHITTTFTGTSGTVGVSNFVVYINGTSYSPVSGYSFDNGSVGTITYTSDNLLRLNGYNGSSTQPKDCDLSDVRIYNTVLTSDQVSDIYNYGTIFGHEILHYKMEKTMGTNLVDSSW